MCFDLVGEMVLDILDGLLAGQPVARDDGGGVDLLLHCKKERQNNLYFKILFSR
jgi:hypothetical protein